MLNAGGEAKELTTLRVGFSDIGQLSDSIYGYTFGFDLELFYYFRGVFNRLSFKEDLEALVCGYLLQMEMVL